MNNEAIKLAKLKSMFLEPDNSAPLMTHDIEGDRCTGISSCPIHPSEHITDGKPCWCNPEVVQVSSELLLPERKRKRRKDNRE